MPNDLPPARRSPEAPRDLANDFVDLGFRVTDALGNVIPEAFATLGSSARRTRGNERRVASRPGGHDRSPAAPASVDLRRHYRSRSTRYDRSGDADYEPNPLLRLVELGVEAASTVAELPGLAFGSLTDEHTHWVDDRDAGVPVLHLEGPAGGTATGSLVVDANPTVASDLKLAATSWTGPPFEIPRATVSPATSVIGIDAPIIDVNVVIPREALVGMYGALLQSGSWPSVRVVLQLRVS